MEATETHAATKLDFRGWEGGSVGKSACSSSVRAEFKSPEAAQELEVVACLCNPSIPVGK